MNKKPIKVGATLRSRELFASTVLAGMIASAYAQGAPAAPTAAASTPADRQAAAKGTNQLETVVVSGFRSSLAAAARAKRDDVGLTDTVFAEDIGKFPDPNITEALARIPGVNVNRGHIDGEGLNISIRGMGAAFTRVLLNGAPMASASGGGWGGVVSANREVDMDFLPSELFRSATVYKSQRASMLEGGIAGTVDMRSARPFDKAGLRTALTLSGNYREEVGKWGRTGSALASNTWDTRFGEVGALVGVAWGHTNYKTQAFQAVDMRNFQLKSFQTNASDRPNSTGGGSQSTPDTVPANLPLASLPEYARSILVPGAQINRAMLLSLNPGASITQIDNGLMGRLGRHMLYEGQRDRASGIVALQWRPSDAWDFYFDGLVAEKKNALVQQSMAAGTRANTPVPIGMEFDRSDCTFGCVVTKATFANTFWALEYRPMKEQTKFWSANPGFEYRPSDKWTIDGHLNVTSSDFWRDSPSVLLATQSAPSVVTYDNTRPGELPVYSSNLNLNDPSNFGWYQAAQTQSGVRMDYFERRNTTQGARFSVKWGDDSLSVKTGVAYDDIERRYRSYGAGDAWANVACGNNMSYRFFAPNTQLRGTCDGRSAPGPMTDVATQFPGYGQGSTTGAPALTYLGSKVTNAMVPQYAHASDHGFITLDWDKFAKDTDYQYFRDNVKRGFIDASGGYIRERVSAFYTEVNGRTKLFDSTFRYNAGVRVTDTDQKIGALLLTANPLNAQVGNLNGARYDNVARWEYESKKYRNVLPSFSVSYNILPDLIARASGAKAITRANPSDLRQTRLTLTDVSARQGSITNPNLQPFKANSLDLGLEYYMTREAYVSLTGFAKDIVGRPAQRTTTMTLTQLQQMFPTLSLTSTQLTAVASSGGADKHLVEITEPYNIDTKLKVRGLELTWQQPLDMLPVKGFGFTANYTYTKQTDDVPNSPPVANVPPRTSNVSAYYERNGWSFRASRAYTAAMVINPNAGIIAPAAWMYASSRTQIDLSAGVNLKKAFGLPYDASVNLSVWNANSAVSKNYVQFENAVFEKYAPGPSYTVSLRASF